MKRPALLLLALLLSPGVRAADGSLIQGDTDQYPGLFSARFEKGVVSKSVGRVPAPWNATCAEKRSVAELRFEPDPLRKRPSFALLNLSGPASLELQTVPDIAVLPGKTYTLQFDYLTLGSGYGTASLRGAARKTIPLRPTNRTWTTVTENLNMSGEQLTLVFNNQAMGAENGLYLSRISLVESGTGTGSAGTTPNTSLRDRSAQPLPGLFGTYQKDYAALGGLSFLNGVDPDSVLRTMEGGQLTSVEGMPFAYARRVECLTPPTIPQALKISVTNREPVFKGESLLFVFHAKGRKRPQVLDDGEGAVLQALIRGPQHPSITQPLSWQWSELNRIWDLPEYWQRCWVASRWAAPQDIAPGELTFEIWLGQKAQDVDIGGVALITIRDLNPERLPQRDWTYPGHEPDAPWRAEAETRIEQFRKGLLKVRVLDKAGAPVPGARVSVEMKKHAFRFGTAISVPMWHGRPLSGNLPKAEDVTNYRTRSMAYFNGVILADLFHWNAWEAVSGGAVPGLSPENIGEAIAYYQERNVTVGAASLLIPGMEHLPHSLRKADAGTLREALTRSIRARVEPFANRVGDWVVVSQTAGNSSLLDTLGLNTLADVFRETRRYAPDATLWLDEPDLRHAILEGSFSRFGIEKGTGWLGWLKAQGAPVTGLSLHSQGGLLKRSPEQLWRMWDLVESRYQAKLRFTKLHVNIRDPKDPAQIDYQVRMLRDSLITAFAHPAVEGVELSGFWAGSHPFPNSAIWDQRWEVREMGRTFLDLVFKTWWTKEEGQSDAEGAFQVRGFAGEYDVRATLPDGTALRKLVTLTPQGVEQVLQ